MAFTPGAEAHLTASFWIAATLAALSQVLATAALLQAMHHSSFGVATAMQQSSLPLSAVLGALIFHDALPAAAWAGVGVASAGLAILVWPRRLGEGVGSGAAWGLASGLAFAFALNFVREAGRAFDPGHPIFAAAGALVVVQALQSAGLVAWLAARDRASLRAVLAGWRQAFGAGFFGAAASACWFSALAMAPAGAVRAVGVVEMPVAAMAGRRLFGERLTARQIAGAVAVAAGVVATALATR
jgi:drug/metabolite transporter (DMT)-like permease